METRLASVADAPLIAALHSECFGSSRWSEKQFRESLEFETTRCFLWLNDDAPAGFILYQTSFEEAEILTFCVTTSMRRRGAGRHLVERMLDDLGKKAIRRIFLEVAVDNPPAIALYEKFGFRTIGRRKNYYSRDGIFVDAILFECILYG
jgi:ribosomal-protein-alanine N-acetyltransferase